MLSNTAHWPVGSMMPFTSKGIISRSTTAQIYSYSTITISCEGVVQLNHSHIQQCLRHMLLPYFTTFSNPKLIKTSLKEQQARLSGMTIRWEENKAGIWPWGVLSVALLSAMNFILGSSVFFSFFVMQCHPVFKSMVMLECKKMLTYCNLCLW